MGFQKMPNNIITPMPIFHCDAKPFALGNLRKPLSACQMKRLCSPVDFRIRVHTLSQHHAGPGALLLFLIFRHGMK